MKTRKKTRKTRRWLLVPALLGLLCGPALAQVSATRSSVGSGRAAANEPPGLTHDLDADGRASVEFAEVRFRVRAEDPEGGPVTLWLENPSPAIDFRTAVSEAGPVVREVTVRSGLGLGNLSELRFGARDEEGATTRLSVPLRLGFGFNTLSSRGMIFGDVTGDGRPDAVVRAAERNVAGAEDAGWLLVYDDVVPPASPSGMPAAILELASPERFALLGRTSHESSLSLVDFDGDGVLDVMATSNVPQSSPPQYGGYYPRIVGVHVWYGGAGLAGRRVPDVSLVPTGLRPGLELQPPPFLFDVTGDGRLDVIAAATEVGGYSDTELLVWSAGRLAGDVAPTAILRAPRASGGPALGDVTGDGVADAVLAHADGGAYLWRGGDELRGVQAPAARLRTPGRVRDLTTLHDLTGDGIRDVVLVLGSGQRSSAIAIHDGGDLGGERPPSRVLALPAGTLLGERSVQDVTGDGVLDLVVVTRQEPTGPTCATVWAGGTGAAPEPAILPLSEETFGSTGSWVRDFDGDGVADVLATDRIRLEGEWRARVAFWRGDRSFEGLLQPDVVLDGGSLESVVPFPGGEELPASFLTLVDSEDVSGDGRPDLLFEERTPYTLNPPDPPWELRVFASLEEGTEPIELHPARNATLLDAADVTGDGVADVLLARDGRRIELWKGGPLLGASGVADSYLIRSGPAVQPRGSLLCDLDLDGTFDLLVPNGAVDVGGVNAAGVVDVWYGGPSLLGTPQAARAVLASPAPNPGDRLGALDVFKNPETLRAVDLDGDGVLEILVAAPHASDGGVQEAGLVHLFAGPTGRHVGVLRTPKPQLEARLGF